MSRASKSGLAADIERKLEHQYDNAHANGTPVAIRTWIEAVVPADDHPRFGKENDWKTLNAHLKDGIMLCKLINILLKSEGKTPVQFQKKVLSPFVAMTNIENFNKGAIEYGVSKEDCFQTTDLTEQRKGPFLNVINSLHSLGSLAKSKNFSPRYEGVQAPHLEM